MYGSTQGPNRNSGIAAIASFVGFTSTVSTGRLAPLHEILKTFRHVSIVNDYETHEGLRLYLDALDLLSEERLRPSWDSYFMTLSELAAQRSNCMKRRVGAILVRHNRILATG